MAKKVAVLLDGSFVTKTLYRRLKGHATPEQVHDFARACVSQDEELFRIYYYDCPPYSSTEVNPISRASVDFSQTPQYNRQVSFQDKLARMDNVAFRRGIQIALVTLGNPIKAEIREHTDEFRHVKWPP